MWLGWLGRALDLLLSFLGCVAVLNGPSEAVVIFYSRPMKNGGTFFTRTICWDKIKKSGFYHPMNPVRVFDA